MLDLFKKNKLLSLGAVVVVLAFFYYFFLSGSSTPSPALSESGVTTSPVSQSLLVTLNNLHTLKLDGAIFQDPVFLSLTDFGVVIPPEAVGKRDPFLPLGSSASSTSPTKTKH